MKVLIVSNRMGEKGCGVALYGQLQHKALLKAGIDSTLWEASYPVYLPPNAEEYDVVHLNWHPVTINHILPQHLPKGPLISAMIHEAHPGWWEHGRDFPEVWDSIQLKLVEMDIPGEDGAVVFQMPVPDYIPTSTPLLPISFATPITIGHTGIRGDGLDYLAPICEKNCWKLTKSGDAGRWLTIEEEVERLAKCHVIVVRNHGGYSGQASAVCTAIASRRPVLVNNGWMLRYINKINEEEFGGGQFYKDDDIERGVMQILGDIRRGEEKRPHLIAEHYSWTNQTKRLIGMWEERLK